MNSGKVAFNRQLDAVNSSQRQEKESHRLELLTLFIGNIFILISKVTLKNV
jgi:hypothetical protein